MLIKRKIGYKARFQIAGIDTEIPLAQTRERDARQAHDIIAHELKSKRIARILSKIFIQQAIALARKELTREEAEGLTGVNSSTANLKALDLIAQFFPAPKFTASMLWEKYLSGKPVLKQSTLETKLQRFGKFIEWAGSRDCSSISARECKAFLDSLTCAALTRNHYIGELSSVWQASPELRNPWTEALREHADVKHKQAFTRDQVRDLLEYCKTHNESFWRVAILIGYYTGLRLTDVVHLRRAQVADGYIDLTPAKTARSGRRVRIPVAPQLADALASVPLSTEYYFPEQVRLYQLNRSHITHRFRAILDGTTLYRPGVGVHSLRHTFVTEALAAGIDIKQVQAVVGHISIELTEGTYYHGERHANLSAYPAL